MTFDLATSKPKTMPFTRANSSRLPLATSRNDDDAACSSLSSSLNNSSDSQRKLFLAPSKTTFGKEKRNYSSSSAVHALLALLVTVIACDLLTSPVDSSPLPSSSAWSLPTLNYLFKDTKTRSQSTQYKRESENGDYQQHNHKTTLNNLHSSSSASSLPGTGGTGNSMENGISKKEGGDDANKVSSTGRLISAHDIRLTDNWGWVRRGASDPQTTTEQRRKQNIRHSKSKHKQRHHYSSSASAASGSGGVGGGISSSSRGRNKDKKEHLLCPFDEIRGPDGKCRKAPRFSLYRVGRK